MTGAIQGDRDRLPAPNSDFYELYETLNAEELATARRVRTFMEAKVAPVVTQYWVDDAFPFELLPAVKGLGVGGIGMQGYGCAGGAVTYGNDNGSCGSGTSQERAQAAARDGSGIPRMMVLPTRVAQLKLHTRHTRVLGLSAPPADIPTAAATATRTMACPHQLPARWACVLIRETCLLQVDYHHVADHRPWLISRIFAEMPAGLPPTYSARKAKASCIPTLDPVSAHLLLG